VTDERDPDDEALRQRVREALEQVHRPAPGLVRRCAEAVARRRRRTRLPALLAGVALAAVTVAAVAAVLVQHSIDRAPRGPLATATPSPSGLLYALTAANQVIAMDQSTLRVRWRTAAAPPPSEALIPGALMAMSGDGATLYVLPLPANAGGSSVVLLDAASGRLQGSVTLSAPGGTRYRTMAVDPRTGRLLVVGQDGSHIVVTSVDPVRRLVLATQVTRTLPARAGIGDDIPYQALITADGSRLYYSYGEADPDRSGIDWAEWSGETLTPCASSGGAACLPGPGAGFALQGGSVLFGDGSVPPNLVTATRAGTLLRRSATGLAVPFADVTLDGSRTHVLAVGDCPSLGGLSSIEVAGGALQAISSPAPAGTEPSSDSACGRRPALLAGGTLAVSRLATNTAKPESPGEVDVIAPATGRIVRTASLQAEVVDLLAGR